MMMMTYHDNAEIPTKLKTFYENAFSTLYSWHDAQKDSWSRPRCLGIDAFKKFFYTFCLFSYYQQDFVFSEDLLRSYVKKSLAYQGIDVAIDDVIRDITETVNLMQLDGLQYVFIHRSFQEYFCAYCITSVISEKTHEFLFFYGEG